MTFSIDRRPQTGPLNPALLNTPASTPPAAPAPSEKPQKAAAAPQDVVTTRLSSQERTEAFGDNQPVQVAFPERGGRAVGNGLLPDVIRSSQNTVALSRLNEILTTPKVYRAEDAALLAGFGLKCDGGRLLSRDGQPLTAQDRQRMILTSRRHLTTLINQGNALNADMSRKLGLEGGSMDDWYTRSQTGDQQVEVFSMMLESNRRLKTVSVDEARQYSGVLGFMANATSATSGFNEALTRMMRGEDAGNLDLKQGANFTFAQLLTETDTSRLEQLGSALDKATGGQSLNTGEIQLLRQFGIHAGDGQLRNLISGETLPADQLQAIRQATGVRIELVQGKSGVAGLALDGSSRLAAEKIQAAVANLDELQTLRNSLDQRALEIDGLREQVLSGNHLLEVDTTAITAIETRIADRQATQTVATEVSGQLSTPGGEDWIREQARSGKLVGVNRGLAGIGLNLSVTPQGTISYRAQGQPVTRAVFQGALVTAIGRNTEALAADQRDLAQHQADREQHLADTQQATDALEVATQAQERDLASYDAGLSRLESRSLPELRALKADPASWNRLPQTQREQIDALLARGETERRQAPARLERFRNQLSQARQTVQASRALLTRVREAAVHTANLLKDLQAALATQDTGTTPAEAVDAASVEALMDAANRLSRTLTLAARPASGETAAEKELTVTLAKLSAVLSNSQREQASKQQLQAHFEQSYLQTSLDNLHYHLERLQALDRHGELQRAAAELQPRLSELRP